jgi:hypothetical protein
MLRKIAAPVMQASVPPPGACQHTLPAMDGQLLPLLRNLRVALAPTNEVDD